MGTIATQSIMQGLGVGATATTALAATMTLILKGTVSRFLAACHFAMDNGFTFSVSIDRWYWDDWAYHLRMGERVRTCCWTY